MADIFDTISTGDAFDTVISPQMGDVFDEITEPNPMIRLRDSDIPESRNFFQNIWEAGKRGRSDVLANMAIYEAKRTGDESKIQGALNARRKMYEQRALDPVDGNFLADFIYANAKTAGQLFENIKRMGVAAVLGGLITGTVAAAGAAILGQLGPQAALPEEVVTVPLAFKGGFSLGAKVAGTLGSFLFAYREGSGGMYAALRDEGVGHKGATRIADIAGIPYGLLEVSQAMHLIPGLKPGKRLALRGLAKTAIAKELAKRYGKKLALEVSEEMAQEIVQIAAEDYGKTLTKEGIKIDMPYFIERSKRVATIAREATKGFALLPIGSVGIETAIAYEGAKVQEHLEEITGVKPRNVPVNKLVELANVQQPEGFTLETPEGTFELMESEAKEPSTTPVVLQEQSDGSYTIIKGMDTIRGAEAAGVKSLDVIIETPNKIKAESPLVENDVTMPVTSLFRGLQKTLSYVVEEGKEAYAETEDIRAEQRKQRFKVAREFRQERAVNWRSKMKQALKGEYGDLHIKPLNEFITPEVYEALDSEIQLTNKLLEGEALNLGDALQNLYKEGKPFRPYEIKLAEKLWGRNVANMLDSIAQASKIAKINWTDYLALPKATSAAIDISRTMRQNWAIIGNLKQWLKSFVRDTVLFAKDEEAAQALIKEAQTDPVYETAIKAGLKWNEYGEGATYAQRTEKFASRIAHKIPGIKRSDRAYTVGGNLTRFALFKEYLRHLPENATSKQLADLAHIVNILTGEGDAKWFGKHGATLNALFFAPRLIAARVSTITSLFDPKLSWASRKILAYHVASAVGITSLTLALLSRLGGVHVELDPRSADWGKLRIKNQRFDMWGGYQQLARLAVQLATEQRKTRGGVIVNQSRVSTITRFLQSKLSPAAGYGLDLLRGETFYGDEVSLETTSIWQQFYNRFAPFFLQDIADAMRHEGFTSAVRGAGPAFLGVGVQTYPMSKGTESAVYRDNTAKRVLGMRWDSLGPEVQNLLREEFPAIAQKERQAQYDRTNYAYLAQLKKEQMKSEKRIYNAMPKDVQVELDRLTMRIGGVGRNIGRDWHLNRANTKKYEQFVIDFHSKLLPKAIRSPFWAQIPDEEKVQILQDLIDDSKKTARELIITQADMSDMKRLERK